MQATQVYAVSTEWLAQNIYGLVTALVVFLAGWYFSGLLAHWSRHWLHRTPGVDLTIAPILVELVRYFVLGVTLVIVLGQFGVQTASILAVLGAIGLAIALALQGTLSNMAAGIMLLWLRPFGIGEAIDAEGTGGSVTEVGIFATRLRTYDGVYVFVPNAKLWNARIVNWSREPTRMVEVKIGINYTASIARAKAALAPLTRDPRVLADPAPSVFVSALGNDAVQMCVRLWVTSSDWWDAYVDMMERAKTALDDAGIDMARHVVDMQMPGTGRDRPAPLHDGR